MSKRSKSRGSSPLGLPLLCIVVTSLMPTSASAQPPAQPPAGHPISADPVYVAWGQNSEVSRCGLCHYEPGNAFVRRPDDFCALDEVQQWLEQDKHAISRQRIEPLNRTQLDQRRKELQEQFSERGIDDAIANQWLGESNLLSYRMCQTLGYELDTAEGFGQFRDNCLTCHAGYDVSAGLPVATTAAAQPGIQCTYCHQLGDQDAWIDRHSRLAAGGDWRLLDPQEKADFGMRHLISPEAQGELCTTCHVGDHARGMFVSHAMYAAGHPPLPGFEQQTFIENMPPHWRDREATYQALSEYSGRDTYFERNYGARGDIVQDSMPQTRTLLIGAVQAAQKSAALLADAGEAWGDYALYDCSACHHQLRLPSVRQASRGGSPPGRPRLAEWPDPLLQVALRHVANADVDRARSELAEAIGAAPFGRRAACEPIARELVQSLDTVAGLLTGEPLTATHARRILEELAASPLEALLDYNAARQIVWGMQWIDRELADKGQPLPPQARQQIAELGRQEGRILIATGLPSGRAGLLFAGSEPPQSGFLADELARYRAYDPLLIKQQLDDLAESLR